jgi:hypothetical protein
VGFGARKTAGQAPRPCRRTVRCLQSTIDLTRPGVMVNTWKQFSFVRHWAYMPEQMWPGVLKGKLSKEQLQKIQTCLHGLQPHRRPDWDGGELLHIFLQHVKDGTVVYPVALGHALVAQYHVYFDSHAKYHTFDEPWADHVDAVLERHPHFQNPHVA